MKQIFILVFVVLVGIHNFPFCQCHEYDFESEELIWSDDFDTIDESKWNFLVSSYPDGDLSYFRQNVSNQYISDGILNLDHTFTAFDYGEEFLYTGELDLNTLDPEHPCNQGFDKEKYCKLTTGPDILPPVTGNRLDSRHKFSFTYGRVEIRAKNMLGDFVRTALWMVSEKSVYGSFPRSGEIDINESTGMKKLITPNGESSRGIDWFQDVIHYGPSSDELASFVVNHYDHEHNFADNWHTFGIVWTDTYLAFILDGNETRRIAPGEGGMWEYGMENGGFEGDNIYKNGTIMAPFDQDFYIIISTDPGRYWPYTTTTDPPTPWDPNSEDPCRQFWEARDSWLSSFTQPYLIDYVKVYQDAYQRKQKYV